MPTCFASTRLIGLEIVERARRAPRPRAQRAPVVRLARLALVDEADDALRQPGAVVGLDAAGIEGRVAPAVGDQLLGRRRIAAGGRRAEREAARPHRPLAAAPGAGGCRDCAAEHDHHRHRPFASAGVTSVIWMSTVMAGYDELSTCPTSCLADDRTAADRAGRRSR